MNPPLPHRLALALSIAAALANPARAADPSAALIAACQANYRVFKNGVNLSN